MTNKNSELKLEKEFQQFDSELDSEHIIADIDDGNSYDDFAPPQGKWYHATGHIACGMVGTGVLGLANAFSQLSWYVGPPTLLIAFFVSMGCSRCLSYVHTTPDGRRLGSYIDIGIELIGKKRMYWALYPWMFMGLVGCCIAYLIAAGENCRSIVLQYTPESDVKLLVYTSALASMQLVLAICPSLEKFRFISLFGFLMSIVYTTIAVALSYDLKFSGTLPEPSYSVSEGKDTADIVFGYLRGLATMAFAFGFQLLLPMVQSTMMNSPPAKLTPRQSMNKGLNWAFVFAFVMYFMAAIAGYYAFGKDVGGDVLVTISSHCEKTYQKVIITIAQVCIVLHVMIAYQLYAYIMYNFVEKKAMKILKTGKLSPYIRLFLRWAYVLCTWFVAIMIPFWGDIMSLVGSLSNVPICFLLPCVFYMIYKKRVFKLRVKENDDFAKDELLTKAEKVGIGFVVLMSVVVGLGGSIASIRQIILDANTFKVFI